MYYFRIRRSAATFATTALLGVLLCAASLVRADTVGDVPALQREDVLAFIAQFSQRHNYDPTQLTQVFDQVRLQQSVIDAISRPAEGKPWHQYRNIFVTESRILEGVAFWNEHQDDLLRAEQQYGVPAEIIVAILGVETRYGRHKGVYRVMDSLATLAFNYPKRGEFFRSELEHYLLLSREEAIDPLSITGSYAGAMGQAQFIASSYRNFAIDFNGDGHRDLWHDTADAIGSVANYFNRHKWQPGEPITLPAMVGAEQDLQDVALKGPKPHTTVAALQQLGVMPLGEIDPQFPAALIQLETVTGHEYWLGLPNFYVITRYNHSPLYAMAVYQLGQAILSYRIAQSLEQGDG